MNAEQAKNYILNKPEAVESTPFGSDAKVYKVRNKMFSTLVIGQSDDCYWLSLKCDPDEAVILRETFKAIVPGYHMNKRHWNTIILDGSIPGDEIEKMIDNSFLLVIGGMSDIDCQALEAQL